MRKNNEVKNYLYLKAWDRVLKEYTQNPDMVNRRKCIQKLVFYGVKYVVTNSVREDTTREQAELDFQLISIIKSLVGLLEPSEFVEMFPITKDYDGDKYQTKDYFYTRDYINTLDPNVPIGEKEDPLMFLWEYTNKDIENFNIKSMLALSKLRQFDGYPSIGQEFADIMGIKTQELHTGSNGQEFFINDKGKTVRMTKRRPRYLKVVK
ncbi:hypothetical protein [uncultured Tissierella sp.]|uniref:hypothetical protein n=1 Tax=uncultured Tissierella sp. TaxID=448160 RepID=UPI002805D3A9|nr:hypothetical protein [uncultured Tissierella sp.]MDU5081990.1 hypothetical protein [Bacillota bacterium]